MREIPLTQGKVALVDDEDYNRVMQYRWCTCHTKTKWYAHRGIRTNGRNTMVRLHRFILSASPDMQVDHIDGDGLNCVRSNLRICTHGQNNYNRRKDARNTSGYKGVRWNKDKGRWQARIKHQKQEKHLGYFDDIISAALAYDVAARSYFGEFAHVNFP